MGFTKRRANTKCKVNPDNFDEIKQQYLIDIRAAIEMEDIPPSLIIKLGSYSHKNSTFQSVDNGEEGYKKAGNSGYG